MGLHVRRHLVRSIVVLLLAVPVPTRAANRHWLPPVQISHEDDSAIVSNVRRGALTRSLHATIGSQSPIGSCNINNQAPDYVVLSLNAADWPAVWDAAWSARERFEWDNPNLLAGWFAPDVRFRLDDADSAHLAWETHQIHLASVAYKQRRSGWAGIPPAYSDQAPDSVSHFDDAWHEGGSPNLFIETAGSPGTADDIVHVIFKSDGSIWHRAKVIGGTWGPGRVVTDSCLGVGESPAFVVTADARLHMMGTCIINGTAATVRHLAFELRADSTSPPDSTWTQVDNDSLDSYTVNPNPNEPLEDLSEALEVNVAALGGGGGDTLHIVYHVDGSSEAFQREIMYRRYAIATDVWSQRYIVTPPDGSRSMYPELFVAPGGVRHVMYVEGNRRRWERYFDRNEHIELCEHGTTDPEAYSETLLRNELRYVRAATDAVWSLPEPFTADMRTAFDGPKFIAEGDTVWVVFSSHDDDDLATSGEWYDGNVETWFRKGVPMPQTTIASGESLHWNGEVYLDRDFVVQAGGRLIIDAGTAVVAASLADSVNAAEGTPGLVDILIYGDVEVRGTEARPVVFRSVERNPGDWGGLGFHAPAVAYEAGIYGEQTSASFVHHARIANGTAGIRIRNTGAPALQSVSFEEIAGDRHIVLDGSDVYVPFEGGWTLPAGTRVKVRPHGVGQPEIAGRNPGLVDLVGHGPFVVEGVEGDSVHFEAEGAHADSLALGRAWGGILVDWFSTGNSIAYADIGHALTPLTLLFQDMPVEHSRLHDFANEGLRVQGIGWTEGPRIRWNLVERGNVDDLAGRDGMVFVECADGDVLGNEIRLTGTPANAAGGAGIRIIGGKTYCMSTSTHTLWVDTNLIIGPGGDHDPPGNPLKWSGIYGDWMCGAGDRDVLFTENVVEGWNGAGITLLQTKDVQFTCNEVRDSFHGVDFSRNTDVTGPPARFRANVLKVGDYGQNSDQDVARTDSSPKLALGPGTSDKGSNQLVADGEDWFLRENDDTTAALNAASSYWKRNGVHYVQADTATMRTFFTTDLADPVIVDVSNALEVLPDLCGASAMETPRDGLAQTDRPEDALPTEAPHASDLPDRTDLTIVRSAGLGVEIRLALSGREERAVVVEVFNVAGRRVETVLSRRLGGGRYGVSWSGTAGDGSRVGAGVYLIRMRAGEETRVRKAVLVR